MILIGAEFFDYACFKQQFVSLRSGLNLLVGKNNAGKTALLKGVAATAALPIQGRMTGVPQNAVSALGEYVRHRNAEPIYEAAILFRMREEDGAVVRTNQSRWTQLVAQQDVIAAYKFWFFPQRSEPALFNSCEVRIPEYQPFHILRSTPLGIEVLGYELPEDQGAPKFIESTIMNRGSGVLSTSPDGTQHFVHLPAGYHFDGLAPLARVRYVSPHRVVAPWIQIQTAEVIPESADNLADFPPDASRSKSESLSGH